MHNLFLELKKRCDQGKNSVLVTITAARGSVPRSVGAYMAVGENGRICGTIGGGNLEYQATLAAQKLLQEKRNDLKTFHLHAEQAGDLGMICGGQAEVLFYLLDAGRNEDIQLIEMGVRLTGEKESFWLLLPLQEGKAQICREAAASENRTVIQLPDQGPYYAEQFTGGSKVYIFGGGHLAQEVVPLLAHLGFRCFVADDREEFAGDALFPAAEEVRRVDFAHLEKEYSICSGDYLLIMTRGHLCDVDCVRFALGTPAAYIGAVGSRKKAAFIRGRLLSEGFTEAALDRVITPVGLDIGSETPAEIAVSIAAQIIQMKSEKTDQIRGTEKVWKMKNRYIKGG